MSRSFHNARRTDKEFWSRRPSKNHGTFGPDGKHNTHRAERQEGKRIAANDACQQDAAGHDEKHCLNCQQDRDEMAGLCELLPEYAADLLPDGW